MLERADMDQGAKRGNIEKAAALDLGVERWEKTPVTPHESETYASRQVHPFAAALSSIFRLLDQERLPYVIPHGYENLPFIAPSDIDILVEKSVSGRSLQALLSANAQRIGTRIIRRNDRFFTLEIAGAAEGQRFVQLDFSDRATVDGLEYASAKKLIQGRARHGDFWIPAPADEFSSYLARVIIKERLDEKAVSRLSILYGKDSKACLASIEDIAMLPPGARRLVADAVNSGDWGPARLELPDIAAAMRAGIRRSKPWSGAFHAIASWSNRLRRMIRPGGMSVVMLGPDGAGKSTLIEMLELCSDLPFEFVEVRGFAPPMHRLIDKSPKKTDTPHALPPRPLPVSLAKASYWLAHSLAGHLTIRLKKMADGLVLFDRHFMDILVDPIRYRYGGSRLVLRIVDFFTPVSDLIVLLDAPAEVLHARKPELDMCERHRQRQAYLDLVMQRSNAIIIDATKPREAVFEEVRDIIISRLAERA